MSDFLPTDEGLREIRSRVSFLCTSLLTHYTSFIESFERARLHHSTKDICILFGVSGVGKTTTIARLKSTLSPDEFIEALKNEGRDSAVIEDLVIGHQVGSTTVEPESHLVGGQIHVVDVAGFAENDENKKIVIDILSKCFLTKVFEVGGDRLRLICVIDVASIYEPNAHTLLTNYHEALRSLLGEDAYLDAIDTLSFLVTKNMDPVRTVDDIEARMAQVTGEILSLKGKDILVAAKLVQRMRGNHDYVNLQEDTHQVLLSKVQNLIQRSAVATLRRSGFSLDRLQAGENKLNEKCNEYVQGIVSFLQHLINESSRQSKAWKEAEVQMTTDKDQLWIRKKAVVGEKKRLQKSLHEVQSKLDNYREALNRMIHDQGDVKKSLENNLQSLEVYQKQKRDVSLVSVHCDVSREICRQVQQTPVVVQEQPAKPRNRFRVRASQPMPVLTGMAPVQTVTTHSVDLRARVNVDGSSEFYIVVVEKGLGRAAIEDHLRTKNIMGDRGGIIPQSLTELHDLEGEAVLFKSERKNICGAKCVDDLRDPGVKCFTIVDYSKPFEVYVYKAHPFDSTPFAKTIETHYRSEVQRDQARLEDIGTRIKSHKETNDHNLLEKKNLQAQIDLAMSKLRAVNKSTKDTQVAHRSTVDSLRRRVTKVEDQMEQVKNDSVLQKVKEVMEIFRTNRIDTALLQHLEKVDQLASSLTQQVASQKTIMAKFEADNQSSLSDVLSLGTD